MLAYRHAFHAGNHADVLKHLVFIRVLRYMNLKDKPYRVVDTHAGAGGYSLESQYAKKKGEFEQGIARFWDRDDLPPELADYVALVRQFNADGKLAQYPGSPALAHMLLRPGDQLRLFELHPTDHRILDSYLGAQKGVQVVQADGFDSLKSQVPPSMRRGVVLMDPSYEIDRDYARVIASLRDAVTRFAEGVYLVWYPQLQKLEAVQLVKRLEAIAPRGWLHARLTVQKPDARGFGLMGSGMFVINPPHTLHGELARLLPLLTEVLAQVDDASFVLDHKPV